MGHVGCTLAGETSGQEKFEKQRDHVRKPVHQDDM